MSARSEYYARRAVAEVELAQTASCPEASRAHRDLARLYCVQRDTEYVPGPEDDADGVLIANFGRAEWRLLIQVWQ